MKNFHLHLCENPGAFAPKVPTYLDGGFMAVLWRFHVGFTQSYLGCRDGRLEVSEVLGFAVWSSTRTASYALEYVTFPPPSRFQAVSGGFSLVSAKFQAVSGGFRRLQGEISPHLPALKYLPTSHTCRRYAFTVPLAKWRHGTPSSRHTTFFYRPLGLGPQLTFC